MYPEQKIFFIYLFSYIFPRKTKPYQSRYKAAGSYFHAEGFHVLHVGHLATRLNESIGGLSTKSHLSSWGSFQKLK